MSPTEPDPSAEPRTEPTTEQTIETPEPSPDDVTVDPDSPGLAATKPLDDPSRGDAEPNEPA